MFRGLISSFVGAGLLVGSAFAEPLSKKNDIDFFRDVPSRNLKGLATRSDGRLVAGPVLTELSGPAPADILWTIEATPDAAKFLVGTGADGRILELTLNLAGTNPPGFTSREVAKLDDPQVFALKRLADGSLLAGTSPKGALYLVRDGKPLARVALPVDSIFDLLLLDADTALVATGNPGRIYRVDLKKFATVGVVADRITDAKILADRGITLFGEIRDRNVRRIAKLTDGRIVAGSAPRGNLYVFAKEPGAPDPGAKLAPVILQENRDAEVTDLLPQPNGELLATIVFSSSSGESRLAPPPSQSKGGGRENAKEETPAPPPAQIERFSGRSALVLFPADGFPETLASRSGAAFYRLAKFGDTVVIAGGEQGEFVGYDAKSRLALTFAGSLSAQLNGLLPLAGAPGRFLILRNNAPGFALLDFNATGAREAETRRLDLGTSAQLGALRFNRLRNLADADLALEIRTSNGSDDLEGWSAWTPLRVSPDGGWRAEGLRGRYAKLRLKINPPAAAATERATIELDRAGLYALPQNRRPQLQDFRLLTPGYGILPASEPAPQAVVSLNQLLQGAKDEDRRRQAFLNSSVVPAPGTQVVIWHVTDPDNDGFTCTFSIRRDGDTAWTDIATATKDSFAQFDTKHLPDGVYFTRLVATETAPRPPAERLSQTFETDDLVVDHTPPELIEPSVRKTADSIVVTVRGRDRHSLLDGIEVVFSNGVREVVEQPVDGVRDGREEAFTLDVPLAKVSNATSLELTLYDAAGNSASTRLKW